MPGCKQELANYGGHSSHGASRPAAESSLLNHLVHLWGIGEISASACQAIAQAAHKDGLNHEAVVKLASTGAWGTCPNNISRGLKNFIAKESKATFALPHVSQNIPCYWCYHSSCMGRKSLRDKIAYIWSRMQALYKELGIENKLSFFKSSMFINADRPHQEKPFFKLKAGERKSLVHVFAQLAVEFHAEDEASDSIIGLCECMAKFTDLLDSCGRHPTALQAAKAEDCKTELHLQLNRPTDMMWHITIKFHMGKHLATSFKFGNPKYTWCFRSEDFVGRLAKLAHSCCFGTEALALSVKVAEKYRLMMYIRLWQSHV